MKMSPPCYKREEAEADLAYLCALQRVRRIAIAFGFLAFVMMLVVPEIRNQILAKNPLASFIFCMFEIMLWVNVSGFSVYCRTPANYVSVLLMKCFIFYDTRFKCKLQHLKVTWLEAVLNFNLRSKSETKISQGWEWERTLTFISPAILIPAITLFTNCYIGDYEIVALVGSTMSTTLAMGILTSSMGMERFGEFGINLHFRICLLWSYITSAMTFFNLLYITQRTIRYQCGRMDKRKFSRTITELMIYFLSTYIMIHYVPVIHPKFAFENMYTFSMKDFIWQLIPSVLREWGTEMDVVEGCKEAVRTWFNHFKYFCPGRCNNFHCEGIDIEPRITL